jgi:hypothetical protein
MKLAIISSNLHIEQINYLKNFETIKVLHLKRKNFFNRAFYFLFSVLAALFSKKLFMPRSTSLEYVILYMLFNKKTIGLSDGLLDFIDEIPNIYRKFFPHNIENLEIDERLKDHKLWIKGLNINYDSQSNMIVYYPKKYGKILSKKELRHRLPIDYKDCDLIISTRKNKYSGSALGIISHPSTVILQAKLISDINIFFIPTLSDIDSYQIERMELYSVSLKEDKRIKVI